MMNLGSSVGLMSLFVFMACSVLAQGPLTPPGAPAPTMRTLQQIEPRTPITNVPYTITQPGSYYLAGNMSSTGTAITIRTNFVTLDLSGFSLNGPGSLSPAIGISISNGAEVVGTSIRNGIIQDFGGGGIVAFNSRQGVYENLILHANGIFLQANGGAVSGNRISGCTTYHFSSSGRGIQFLQISGFVEANRVEYNLINGGEYGIRFIGNNGFIRGNTILYNQVIDTSDHAIQTQGRSGRIEGNHMYSSTASGFPFGPAGLASTGPANFIFENTVSGSYGGYGLNSNDVVGPIVFTNGALSATGAASHPKANFWW